jgi:hypothetical protein
MEGGRGLGLSEGASAVRAKNQAKEIG